jgi:DNA-binding GntR family transcriptional regulator
MDSKAAPVVMTGGMAVADPMYRVIADELRQEIESGELRPGSQLPTELALREEFNASRSTVRDAIKVLISLGLVVTRPGQGTFVTERIDPFVTTLSADAETGLGGGEGATYLSEVSRAHRMPFMSEPRVEIQVAVGEIAKHLRVNEGTQLVSRHQSRTIDDTPWSLQTSFYPMEFVLNGATRLLEAANIPQGTVQYLEETLGLKQTGYRDWITMRAPDANEMTFFRIPGDGRVPVFEIFRTAFDQSGDPMRVTVSVFPADRNQFIVNVGALPPPQLGIS